MKELVKAAEETGVKLLIENHGGLSVNPLNMVRIVEEVDHPLFGTLPDFGNFPDPVRPRFLPLLQEAAGGVAPEEVRYWGLALIAPYARAVHAKVYSFDASGEDPRVDIFRCVRIMREAGYHGDWGVEFGGEGDDHEGVFKAKELLERALSNPLPREPAHRRRVSMRPEQIVTYLEGLARPDGGYGWEDQPDSYLSVTFAVIGCYRLLRRRPPRGEALADYIAGAHPIRGERTETRIHSTDPRIFLYEQVQSLLWLGCDVSQYVRDVSLWTEPEPYPHRYEIHGYPLLREQAVVLICRRLLGLPLDEVLPTLPSLLSLEAAAEREFQPDPGGRRQRRTRGEHLVGPKGFGGVRRVCARRGAGPVAPGDAASVGRLHLPARSPFGGVRRRLVYAGRRRLAPDGWARRLCGARLAPGTSSPCRTRTAVLEIAPASPRALWAPSTPWRPSTRWALCRVWRRKGRSGGRFIGRTPREGRSSRAAWASTPHRFRRLGRAAPPRR